MSHLLIRGTQTKILKRGSVQQQLNLCAIFSSPGMLWHRKYAWRDFLEIKKLVGFMFRINYPWRYIGRKQERREGHGGAHDCISFVAVEIVKRSGFRISF